MAFSSVDESSPLRFVGTISKRGGCSLLCKVKRRWDFRITDSKRERSGEGGGGGGEENERELALSLCQTRANLFNAALNWPPRTAEGEERVALETR